MAHKVKIGAKEKIAAVEACLEGKMGRTEAKRKLGVNKKTLREWIMLYEARGREGLIPRPQYRRYSPGLKVVRTTLESGKFQPITVTAGTPVEWTIDAPEGSINGCNNRMVIPAYGIEHTFTVGENVIRFTPDKAGVYPYSCWMGMITSSITVVDPGSAADGNEAVTTTAGRSSPDAAAQAPAPASQASCCAPGAAAGQTPDTTGATLQGSCCAPGAAAGQVPDSTDSTALGSCCAPGAAAGQVPDSTDSTALGSCCGQ